MSKKEQVTNNESRPSYYDEMIKLTTKSAMIRFLDAQGKKKGEIAKILSAHFYPDGNKKVLFQHVRNVLITPVKGQNK